MFNTPRLRPSVGNIVLIGGGIFLLALTFRLYRSSQNVRMGIRQTLSGGEANHQLETAKHELAENPEDLAALTAMALAYYQKGPAFYVDAMNALEKARNLGAVNENLFYYAGVMYDALGVPEYAINEFSKYLRNRPGDYEVCIRLANLYFRQNHFEEAGALYRQAIRQGPRDATAWFNYALIHKEKKNYPEALACLERVRKLAGHLPEGGLFQEGEIYRLQGSDERAIQAYNQELAQNPNYLPALESLEALVRRRGDRARSRDLKKRILALKTHH